MTYCTKCKLSKYRRNIVYGRGCIPADIVIIGEAPGQTEDMLGEAFVGPAGQLLDCMIMDAQHDARSADLMFYFTNTVLCRPTDRIGGPNREPFPEEVLSCSQNISDMLDKVNAKHYILCGDVAERYMKNRLTHYTKIMHPSAILRFGGIGSAYYLENVRKLETVFREVYL